MITFVIAGLITALFDLLWKKERQDSPKDQRNSIGKIPVWLLLGILSLLVLLAPEIKDKVRDLRQKYHV